MYFNIFFSIYPSGTCRQRFRRPKSPQAGRRWSEEALGRFPRFLTTARGVTDESLPITLPTKVPARNTTESTGRRLSPGPTDDDCRTRDLTPQVTQSANRGPLHIPAGSEFGAVVGQTDKTVADSQPEPGYITRSKLHQQPTVRIARAEAGRAPKVSRTHRGDQLLDSGQCVRFCGQHRHLRGVRSGESKCDLFCFLVRSSAPRK